jgi:predicted Zn-dependent protease with MMP-like domain/Flp pilus assembly protein TadD
MSRQDRLSTDLDRGFAALENGKLEEAEACLERCSRIDRKDTDVMALAAAVADAKGDAESAIAKYTELVHALPDDPRPRICLARMQLHDEGDPDTALETIEKAFDFIDEEDDLIEAVITRTEALILVDDLDSARESLAELASSVIEDPHLALELGELALAAGDPNGALKYVAVAQKDEELTADALHLLGFIHETRDDREAQSAAWLKVRELDKAAPPSGVTISEDEAERIARETLSELPEEARKRLAEVPILIDDVPSAESVADGEDPRALGVFEGASLRDGELSGAVTHIRLYKTNLERMAADLDHLAEQIRITVLHETAHYFGLEEDDLTRLGLD